jgi:uncharacterized membrane protein
MNRRTLTASILASAVGLATAAAVTSAASSPLAAGMKAHPGTSNIIRVAGKKMQKCYGINAVGKNDCAAGAHSCAGQATQARDANSFVLLPAGDCGKIAGGSLKAAKSKS